MAGKPVDNYKSAAPMYLQKENIKSLFYPFLAKNAKRCRNINKSELKKLGRQQKEETAWYYYKDMKVVVCINKNGEYHSSKEGLPAWVSHSGDCQFFIDGDIVIPGKMEYAQHYNQFMIKFMDSLNVNDEGEITLKKSVWFS